jgi:hypothetical protein
VTPVLLPATIPKIQKDSKVKVVDKDGKPQEEDVEDSDTPIQQPEKKAASSKNNHIGFMNQDDIDPIVTV